MAERSKYCQNHFYEMWIENGIVIGVLRNDFILTEKDAMQLVRKRLEISGGNTMPILADITHSMGADSRAKQYLSRGDGIRQLSAGAFLAGNPVSKFMGNLFLSVNCPAIPSKLFTERRKAMQWLLQYK